MTLPRYTLLILTGLLLFSSCSGVIGTTLFHVRRGEGTLIAETQTTGLEIRSTSQNHGLSIGKRVSTYVYPLKEDDIFTARSGWGITVLPNDPTVFTSSRTIGIDLTWEPTFRGISLGINSRSCAALPIYQSARLDIHASQFKPLFVSYHPQS